jgi:outer membrane autotransporter protein
LQGSVAIGGGGGRADIRGLVIGGGLDMPVGDGFTVGLSVGYSDASAVLRSSPQSTQADTIQVAGYGRYDFGPGWAAQAFVAYGHQTFSTHRVALVGGTPFTMDGHTGGDNPSAGLGIGRSFHVDTINGAPITLTPMASLTYFESNLDGFTETGGAPALTFAGFDELSLASRLGIDAKMTFDLWSIRATPNLHLAWVDDFNGKASAITATFAAAPGPIMTFAATPVDRSFGEMGLGVDFDLGDFLGTEATLSGRYDGNTRNDVNYGAWTGRLSIKF